MGANRPTGSRGVIDEVMSQVLNLIVVPFFRVRGSDSVVVVVGQRLAGTGL